MNSEKNEQFNRVAEFRKVSRERFLLDLADANSAEGDFAQMYSNIRLPERATKGSAGYDFFLPFSVTLSAGQTILIPTGIRAAMEEGYVLLLFPRSGLGFRYRLQLDNTVGVIDSDYFYSDNEGHIMAKLTNDSKAEKTLSLPAGSAFMQGVFIPFGITKDDASVRKRNGGFGSTTKQ